MRKPAKNQRLGFVPPKRRTTPGHSARQKTILIVLVVVVCGCALSIFTTRKTQAVTTWTVSPAGDMTNFRSLLNVERLFPSAGSNGFLSASPVGNVLTVTREDDPDNTFGSCNLQDGSSPCSLRQAINYATSTVQDDLIQFAANVHTVEFALTVDGPTEPHTDVIIRLQGSLSIQGPGSGQLTIRRAPGTTGRLLNVERLTSNVFSLSGVTLTGGNGRGKLREDYPGFGGALLTTNVALSLNDVVLTGNGVENKGGALALVWGQLQGTTDTLTMNITNSRIVDNTGEAGCGGIVTLLTLPFFGQTNTRLGSTLNITDTVISDNTAPNNNTNGGGLCTDFQFTNVNNSEISGNTALGDGGGVDVGPAANNVNATLTVRNSTISGNRLHGGGTGAGIYAFFGNVVLEHATIAHNDNLGTSSEGGGIYNNGNGVTTIHNSIIARNSDHSNNCPDICGKIQSNGYNLIGRATGTAIINGGLFTPAGDPFGLGPGDLVGGYNNPTIDALLLPLAFNGGTTQNHALACESPALNTGDPGNFLATDQRGVPRPMGSRPDIGAHESFQCAPTVYNANDSGVGSLRDAITNSPDNQTITFLATFFSQPRTIALTSGEIVINKNLTIDGGGTNSMVISGNNQSRIFTIDGGKAVTLNRLTLSNGNSTSGGAISNNGTLTLTNSTISGNQSSGEGGGITNSSSLNISNSTLSGNVANGKGGAIYNFAPGSASVTATNVTVTNNGAALGGGVFNESGTGSVLAARNSIFAGNTGTFRAPDFDGGLNSLGYNLLGSTDWTGISGDTTGNKTGVSAQLGPLGYYGGPTPTHVLSCSSPAFDAADPNNALYQNNVLSTDQRGVARPFQSRADMGAYEVPGPCELVIGSQNDSGNFSLRKYLADIHYGGKIRSAVLDITLTSELLIDKNVTIDTSDRIRLVHINAGNAGRIFNITNGATVNLLGVRLTNGNTSGHGGAILINQGTTLNAAGIAIQNSKALAGGAIYNAGTLNLTNSTISGNQATGEGGGIANAFSLTISNSTLAGNTAPNSKGGAIYNFAPGNTGVTTTNVTIGNNSAKFGGGVFNETGGLFSARNSIFAGNTITDRGPDFDGGLNSLGYNLIANANDAGVGGDTTGNKLFVAARLAPLGDYGGPTQTFALLSDSPAIDAGDPNDVVGATDQRGGAGASSCTAPRVVSSAVDIGAFERHIFFNRTSLPNGIKGESYNQAIRATVQPCGFSASSYSIILINGQSLPPGISLASDGTLSGTPTTAGTYTFTVRALGFSTMAGAQEFALIVEEGTTPIDLFDTTTSLTCTPDPSNSGDQVTCTATVAENPPQGSVDPTGIVDFIDTSNGNAIICDNAALTAGQATCQTSSLSSGTHNIRADYSGDGNFDPSQSNLYAQDVIACVTNPVVTNTNDSGAGSLRQAITEACNGSTIDFAIDPSAGPHTISLTFGELVLNKNLTIQNTSGESVTVSGNNVSRVFNINSGRTVTIRELTITDGNSGVAKGGAILNNGTLALSSVTISSSDSALTGGAIYNTANLFIHNSTLTTNIAQAGGAIDNASGASATLTNTTISGNTATTGGGGGILSAGTLNVTNGTIVSNDGGGSGGGGIRPTAGTATLVNTIVANNTAQFGPDIFGNVTANHSLIENATAAGISGGNNIIGQDPQLLVIANNGGLTETHALAIDSPALDAGSNCVLTANGCGSNVALTTDQRGVGYPRTADSADANVTQTVDIGAYEAHPTLENIGNQTTPEDTLLSFTFNLGDGTGSLITSVTGTSSNQTLVPDANVSVTGSGSTRTLDINPAANANTPADGTATITVTVLATNGQTVRDTFVVTITEVNDNPDAVNDNLTAVDEDSGLRTIPFTDLLTNDTKGPANETSQTLNVTGVSNPVGGSVEINGTDVEFTVATNFSGTASFDYTVTDDGTTNAVSDPKTDTATASFTVNAVNDEPSFTKGLDQSVAINAGPETVPDWATNISAGPANENLQTLTFNVTNNNSALFTVAGQPAVSPTGTLTYEPATGASGVAMVSVTLMDNGGTANSGDDTSPTQSFTITVSPPTLTVHDAKAAEPASGSTNMIFTVALSVTVTSAVTVNFSTHDEPAGPGRAVAGTCGSGGDYTATNGTVNFTAGQQVKTINVPICSDNDNSEGEETFIVTLSGASGANIVDGTATGTIKVAADPAGEVLISEIRTSGPGGAGDDFVELYNNSNSAKDISGYGLFKKGTDCDLDSPALIATIPGAPGSNTTVIPPRGHYLLVGSQYSLKDYGGADAALGNQTLSADIETDGNVGLFSTADPASISTLNRVDAVGFGANVGGACNLLREASTLPAIVGNATLQHSYFRKMCDWLQGQGCTVPGIPKDTNQNADDFWLADTAAVTGRLGAPGPENLASPIRRDSANNPGSGGIDVFLLDGTVGSGAAPNRTRNGGDPAGTFGSMTLRYRVTNNTGGNVTRLRYRVVDITTAIQPAGPIADLRALTSSTQTVGPVQDSVTCSTQGFSSGCSVSVSGTTLEAPPAQPFGGGYNSTLSSGTVTTGTPVAPGASILINFKLGVEKTGTFRFYIIIEALP